MAGTITVSTLSDGTNSTSSTNCIQGSAKAWVNYNPSSGSAVIRGSYNVSSVTYVATGKCTINFTNAFASTNYCVQATASGVDVGNNNTFAFVTEATAPATTAVTVVTCNDAGTARNPVYVYVQVTI